MSISPSTPTATCVCPPTYATAASRVTPPAEPARRSGACVSVPDRTASATGRSRPRVRPSADACTRVSTPSPITASSDSRSATMRISASTTVDSVGPFSRGGVSWATSTPCTCSSSRYLSGEGWRQRHVSRWRGRVPRRSARSPAESRLRPAPSPRRTRHRRSGTLPAGPCRLRRERCPPLIGRATRPVIVTSTTTSPSASSTGVRSARWRQRCGADDHEPIGSVLTESNLPVDAQARDTELHVEVANRDGLQISAERKGPGLPPLRREVTLGAVDAGLVAQAGR